MFLDLFVHFENKDTYSIFKDKLYSLCFVTNKMWHIVLIKTMNRR